MQNSAEQMENREHIFQKNQRIRLESHFSELKKQSLPQGLVDIEAFDRNLSRVQNLLVPHNKKIRVASKSIRVPELLKRVLDKSPLFEGIMCFSGQELIFLANLGFDNLFLAYPELNQSTLEKIVALHKQGKEIYLLVDSKEGLELLEPLTKSLMNPLPVVFELDVSQKIKFLDLVIGVRRSPISDIQGALHFAEQIKKYPGLECVGFMAYEAQVAGLGDKNPFRSSPYNQIIHGLRVSNQHRAKLLRHELALEMGKRGFKLKLINGGGSGSLNFALQEDSLTEVTAGSGFLCGHLFDYYQNISWSAALFIALRVVRKQSHRWATCAGGGFVASGAPHRDRWPVIYSPEGAEFSSTEGAGEVQTPIHLMCDDEIKIGDICLLRPAKSGEIAEHFLKYLLLENGKLREEKTYRGLGERF